MSTITVVEQSDLGYKTLSSISSDGIGFRMIVPTDLPKGRGREEHFEVVRPLLDTVADVFCTRKHWADKFREPWLRASFACLEKTCYVTFVDEGSKTPCGTARFIDAMRNEQSNAEKTVDLLLSGYEEKLEIGTFYIENSLPVFMRKRMVAELNLAIAYWYRNISQSRTWGVMLAFTDNEGRNIFRRWGCSPIRKYRDLLSNQEVVIPGDVPDNQIVHRVNCEPYGRDMVLMECPINNFAAWAGVLYRSSGYASDHPVIRQRMEELELTDFLV